MASHEKPPDIYDLFCHYNRLYFHDALGACVLSWSQSSSLFPPSCASDCDYFPGGGCEVLLSEVVLKHRPSADIKNTLLHEMIHAYLWITKKNNDHSDHGTSFQALAKTINNNVVRDPQRPIGGYNIGLSHELRQNANDYKAKHAMCELCGCNVVIPTMKNNASVNDSEGNRGFAANNSSYNLHERKKLCSNCFLKLEEAGHGESSLKGEQDLDEPMSEEVQHIAGVRSKRICRRFEIEKLNEKYNMAGESLATVLGVQGSSKGDASVSVVDPKEANICSKEADSEGLKSLEIDSGHIVAAQEVSKRDNTQNNKNILSGTCLKKRKLGKSSFEPTVIIAWLNFVANEESDEDSEPLLNKRSERRKRQKQLSLKDGIISPNAIDAPPFGSSTDCKGEFSGNNLLENRLDKLHTHPKCPMNEVDVENQEIKTEPCAGGVQQFDAPVAEVAKISISSKRDIEYGSCQITSPLNSPARDDVVDISDGSDTVS